MVKRTKTVNALEEDHVTILELRHWLSIRQGRDLSIPDVVTVIVEAFRASHPEMFRAKTEETQ